MPQKVLSFFVLWSQGSYIAVPCDASRFFRQHRLYLPLQPRFTLLYVVYVHIKQNLMYHRFINAALLNPNRSLQYTYSKSPTENISVQQRDMLLNESPSGAGRFPMHCTIRQSLRRSFRLIANILPIANDTP